jgi:8-amino-7-oxononanoate synthase
MDLFDKCRQFYANAEFAQKLGYPVNPRMAQALGLYPYFIPIDQSEGTEVVIGGKKLIMIGSNNYLGLTTDPRVKKAASRALFKYGSGCTGSRFLNGTLRIHLELEDRLADFVGKEKALVFSTGYQTNLGVISSLIGKDDVVLADKEVHASILDGIFMTRAQKEVRTRFFKHNDPADLETILEGIPREQGKLVIVDGVFSMGGDIAPLPELTALCGKFAARMMVDDAHALGVLGKGHGTAFYFNCVQAVDLIMGTFSKSFASTGGFIAASREVAHWIQHFARSFIFSASLSPANIATVQAVLDIIEKEPERVERVNQIAARMRKELSAMEYDIGKSQTPIVPIIIGDQFKALQYWDKLFRKGIYANVALPPAVPADKALLRTSYMSTHSDEQLDRVLSAFYDLRPKSIAA